MKRKLPEDPPYALYHVNIKTGEKVRFPVDTCPATNKATAEYRALEVRIGTGMSNTADPDWRTEAHPEK